jgi:hypothetical protein
MNSTEELTKGLVKGVGITRYSGQIGDFRGVLAKVLSASGSALDHARRFACLGETCCGRAWSE